MQKHKSFGFTHFFAACNSQEKINLNFIFVMEKTHTHQHTKYFFLSDFKDWKDNPFE